MNRKPIRLAAAALSTLAIVGMTAAPSFAAGDTAPTGTTPTAPLALIDDNATNTLHITKYVGTDTKQRNDGTPIGGASAGTPLADVAFTIYRVTDVDLKTNEGWTAASKYYAADVKPATASAVGTCTTNATGQCDLSKLPNGLYYVEETKAPTGTTMSKPFFVTLPMTDPDGPDGILGNADDRTSWMYDVYVYPKNQQDTIKKAVEDKGTVTTEGGVVYGSAADHQIDYTITTSITDGTDPLGMYVIYDDLDPAITFTGADITVGGTKLTPGTDYVIYTYDSATDTTGTLFEGTAVTGGPVVKIVMTDAGLTKLQADRSAEVSTVLHTTVAAEDADGVIPNTASFIPNENWWDQNVKPTNPNNPELPNTPPDVPGLPSTEVISKYGDLKITKVDGGAPTTLLGGAEFKVYKDADNNDSCTATDITDANLISGPYTTAADGTVTIKGLQASDFYNNATQTDLLTYCLVETKAPEGYNLNADPIKFTIGQSATNALSVTPMTVNNEKQNLGNSLPLTGGEGTAAMSLGGLALVGGGLGYYFFTSRKRREETQA